MRARSGRLDDDDASLRYACRDDFDDTFVAGPTSAAIKSRSR